MIFGYTNLFHRIAVAERDRIVLFRVVIDRNRKRNNCSSLTEIHIPEGVRLIGNKAFKFAWKVKHIVLEPNSYLVDLPEEVFNRCDSVQWIDLPNTVRSLSQNSLPNLRTFILPDCVDSIASSYTPNQLYVPESSQLRVTPQNGSVEGKGESRLDRPAGRLGQKEE